MSAQGGQRVLQHAAATLTCRMAPSNLVLKTQGLVTSHLTTRLTVFLGAIKNVSRMCNRSQLNF